MRSMLMYVQHMNWQWWWCNLIALAKSAIGQSSQNSGPYHSLHTHRQKPIFNSTSWDLRNPYQPIVQNQTFQAYHMPQKELTKQSGPPHPPNAKKYPKLAISRLAYPTQEDIVQNGFFQRRQHTIPNWKLPKINSPFKTTILSPHSTESKVSPYKTTTSSQKWNQSFQDHQILPKWKLYKISSFKTSHPPNVEIVENKSFQDHQAPLQCRLLKICPFKTPPPPKVK